MIDVEEKDKRMGHDVYRLYAAKCLGCSPEEVTPEERAYAKAALHLHAFNYTSFPDANALYRKDVRKR